MQPRIVSLNVSPGGIPKLPVESAAVEFAGLVGDGHNHAKHITPLRAVSILDLDDLAELRAEGFDVHPGATGENVTVEGLNVDSLEVGDRLVFSSGVELELTIRRKPCYVLDAIDAKLKTAIVGRCGYLAKVLVTGELRIGDTFTVMAAMVSTEGG